MTLKVWNTGENVKHDDLNGNFAQHDNSINMLNSSSVANTSAITSLSASAAQNPAVADQAMAGRKITALAQGVASTDAARLDQVGWVQVGATVLATGVGQVAFSLTSSYYKFRMEWTALGAGSSGGILLSRFSQNGGTSYDSGSNYWFGVDVKVGGGSETYSTSTSATYVPLTNGQSGAQISEGFMEFSIVTGKGKVVNLIGASTLTEIDGFFNYTLGAPNSILLALNTGAFNSGMVRLLGWRAQ